jgi:predicted acyltransferase
VNSPVPVSSTATRAATAPSPVSPAAGRLVSLDALRGFDMFWILGADAVIQILGLRLVHFPPFPALAAQFDHKAWAGFAFYDLIFPLFVFIVGASLVFSLSRTLEERGRGEAIKRVLIRTALLFVLGIFYSGGFTNPWPGVRLVGVLQRIALAYGAAGLLFCFFRPRALAVITVGILVGYWALLAFVPIRDIQLDTTALAARLQIDKPTLAQAHAAFDATTARVTGQYEPGLNLTNHLDFQYLPGRMYDTYWDPEGMLSMLTGAATCLLGVFAGLLLRRTDLSDRQKLGRLALAGVMALTLGWVWHLGFPVVKKIWTSSFVLVAGGWSLLLLAAFYYIVDMRRWRGWCQPFIWIGMNAITLYVAANIVRPRTLAQRFAGGSVKTWLETHVAVGFGDFVIALVGLALVLWLARFLYRRQIFLRL